MSRVTDVRYVGYAVTDLAAERAFYRDVWKLKEVHEADGLVYLGCFAVEKGSECSNSRVAEEIRHLKGTTGPAQCRMDLNHAKRRATQIKEIDVNRRQRLAKRHTPSGANNIHCAT